jgi:hypothetical protein
MGRHLLLDPALEAGLRPAALGVTAVKLVVDVGELGLTLLTSAEQPRAASDRDRCRR